MRVACVLLERTDKLTEFAEACIRFTPQIALGESCVFLEIGACKNLYSEASLVVRLQVLLKRFQLRGRIALSSSLPTALALAYFRMKTREALPIEAIKFYFSPFQTHHQFDKIIVALKRLGIETIGEFKALPRKSLLHKLGREALVALHHLNESEQILWKRFVPREKIIENEFVDQNHRVFDLEPVLFLTKKMLDRLFLRLRGHGQVLSELKIQFDLEPYSFVADTKRVWHFDLASPQSSVHSLLPILRERIDRDLQKTPLLSEVIKIKAEVLCSHPLSLQQPDFFNKKNQEEESFRAVVARFTERLGAGKVFYAQAQESYFPERSWIKTLSEPEPLKANLSERPLRILRNPKPMSRVDDWLLSQDRKWQILRIEGPERMSGDWWLHDKERDYFRVSTNTGEELWVFSYPQSQEFYLHGIFD